MRKPLDPNWTSIGDAAKDVVTLLRENISLKERLTDEIRQSTRLMEALMDAATFIKDQDLGDPNSDDGWHSEEYRDAYLAIQHVLTSKAPS